MTLRLFALCVAALTAMPSLQAIAAQAGKVDPDTGAATWETQADGVTLSLTQIFPDPARAFYLNRGFPAEAVERYATACVYMTVLRNDAAPGELSFRLADWSVQSAGSERPPLAVEDWMAQWRALGLTEAAQIAFRWAQFPPQQEYAVGEWNQGMLSTGLPPGSRFDLIARWTVAGKTFEGKLENVVCAR
ncbi:MAG: hypothetical protein Q8M09_13245 [Pseudomonadota bacterium]|nr:hypothetical protein [Pseudomonadota bacterium]MDP1905193.1 hypothetical protein [Pseudomonadota bacterium]MDP2352947.1 hypothetical protein [Pseudomonadota bacterium]